MDQSERALREWAGSTVERLVLAVEQVESGEMTLEQFAQASPEILREAILPDGSLDHMRIGPLIFGLSERAWFGMKLAAETNNVSLEQQLRDMKAVWTMSEEQRELFDRVVRDYKA